MKVADHIGHRVRWDGAPLSAERLAALANEALLDGCERPHDFTPYLPPGASTSAKPKWKCSRCGGVVRGTIRWWYDRGLKDGAP